jgi:hypothetical protein
MTIVKVNDRLVGPGIYMPVRLPPRAVAKLDLIARHWLCATRSEAIRRLIADYDTPPCSTNGHQQNEDAPQPSSEAA